MLLAGATAVSNEVSSSSSGKFVAAAGTTPTGNVQIQTISLDTAQISQPSPVPGIKLLIKDGSPVQILNLVAAAGSAGRSYDSTRPASQPLIALSAADGSVVMTRGAEVVWQREEALAEVSAALFVDLPADPESADRVDANREKTGIMDHIQSQILNLKVSMLSVIIASSTKLCVCTASMQHVYNLSQKWTDLRQTRAVA